MNKPAIYRAVSFNLHGLRGISDRTLEMHFALYEGYVKATNELNEHISGFLRDGKVDQEEMPAYSELTRRLGFEFNGMVLHEYYFGNLKREGSDHPDQHSSFAQATEDSYGSFERWKSAFSSVGMLRGVGWAICYLNPSNGQLSNQWISLHEHGNVSGFVPVLVMDLWEHAYLLDYKPSERKAYIEAFFSNIDWKAVEQRLQLGVPALTRAGRG
jgi:Fe-Mn family superoxide dismutase